MDSIINMVEHMEGNHNAWSTDPIPTVRCKCGWAGVGVQTRKGSYTAIPRCPECGKDNKLQWEPRYRKAIKKEAQERREIDEREKAN